MENKKLDISSAKAVLLGALTPGVNGPTWNTLKSVFLMLGACLAVMLGLAFSSSDSPLILHVGFLVLIAAALFLLLSWFLSQIGLVSVEHQMQEIDCVPDKYRKFDLYLHDYLVKRNLHKTAAIFRNEANVGENPVAVDSFDGFLHEWWTLFYDVYASRQLKHEEAKTKSSVKGGQMTLNEIQNMRPILPKLPIYQQRCGEFPVGPGYGMLGQPPTCLLPTRMLEEEQHLRHPISNSYPNLLLLHGNKLNLSKSATISPSYLQQEFQNQAQLLTPPRNVNSIIQSNPMDTTLHEGVQEGVVARPRSHAAGVNKEVNPGYPSPSNGLLSNSLMQTPSQLQQFPMLAEQPQQNQLSQFQPLIFGNLTSAFPGSSANFDGQNLILPESNMNGKNAENGRKRRKLLYSRTGDKILVANITLAKHLRSLLIVAFLFECAFDGCANSEVDKPANEMLNPFCPPVMTKMMNKGTPLCNVKRSSTACGENDHKGFTFEEIGCLHSSKSKPSKPLFKLLGHADQVMALDFHPRKVDLLCSCDSNDEIRLWNVNRCACTHVSKSLELWNPIEGNKTWSVPAHSGLIAALADSPQAETIASASHDQCVKLWK
ncbi:hypothetical protein GH714_016627 [Hevea brasiliensis]|uniref:LisH domain-containing protein n=1 Tax=Hevea brasiliensis TaxID=3981 RepID=A0A6A6LPH8_HEVBR|nr:hypothetical protein GH714_016627 [Hevea brasiliensis]